MQMGATNRKREPQTKGRFYAFESVSCTLFYSGGYWRIDLHLYISTDEAQELVDGIVPSKLKTIIKNKLILSVNRCSTCGHHNDHYSVCPKYLGACSCGNPNDYHYQHRYDGRSCTHHGSVQ